MSRPDAARRGINPLWLLIMLMPLSAVLLALAVYLYTEDRAASPQPVMRLITPTPYEHPLVGQMAPNFELPALDGGTMRLSSLRGRVVFVNLWATWCEPCRREFPAFEAFSAQQDEAMILAVNQGETPEQVRRFLDELGVQQVPTLLDAGLTTSAAYDIDLFPSTFVISPAGTVAAFHLGEITLDELHQYTAAYQRGG